MSIFDKKVVFIMSFGHCGIDWLQSLFNSHPTILMMPTISFYRVWSNLKCDNITNPIEMTNTWKFFLQRVCMTIEGAKLH